MKKVSNINLKDGRVLYAIPPGVESPLVGQKGGEVAYDGKNFYIHEVFLVCYGVESVERAINSI